MAKGVKTGGRQPGSLNKATQEFRQTVQALLDENRANVALWLSQVANGTPGDAESGLKPVAADPGRALDLLSRLAEFAAPKLGRTELTGKDGAPIQVDEVKRPKLTKAEWLAAHGVGTASGPAK